MTALGKAENFRAHGRKFSYVRKFIFLRKKISPPSNADFSPSAERKIFVRTEKNFLPQENLGVFRRKISCRSNGNFGLCGRRKISVRTEKNFRICENIFSYMRK